MFTAFAGPALAFSSVFVAYSVTFLSLRAVDVMNFDH